MVLFCTTFEMVLEGINLHFWHEGLGKNATFFAKKIRVYSRSFKESVVMRHK